MGVDAVGSRGGGERMGWRRAGAVGRHAAQLGALGIVCLALAACSSSSKLAGKFGAEPGTRVADVEKPIPKGGGVYKVGNPYEIAGKTFVPREDPHYDEVGPASWYGTDFHGRLTANGEVFDMNSLSAAHPTLPLPSYVRVTNLANRRSVVVRINDRGPYARNRVIDVSARAASVLGFKENGVAKVRVQYLGRAPLDGSDDRALIATLRENTAPPPVRVASALPSASVPTQGREPPKPVPTVAVAAATPAAKPAGFAARWQAVVPSSGAIAPTAALADPVSAYAPAGYRAGLVSGRGLY